MQQTINFEPSAQVQQPLDVLATTRRKKSFQNIWQLQNFFLSLLRQNHRFNICNERELVKYPSSFAFQPHKILTAAFHAGFSAYTDLTVVLTNLEAQPSLRLYPAVPGNVKTTVIMATLSIQRHTRRTSSLKEWTKVKGTSINAWLHGRSEFYSRICDFSVTRLLVIRIHLVFLCIIGTVLTVEHHPLLSVVFALCAAYWGHRVNRLDKEGGAL